MFRDVASSTIGVEGMVFHSLFIGATGASGPAGPVYGGSCRAANCVPLSTLAAKDAGACHCGVQLGAWAFALRVSQEFWNAFRSVTVHEPYGWGGACSPIMKEVESTRPQYA